LEVDRSELVCDEGDAVRAEGLVVDGHLHSGLEAKIQLIYEMSPLKYTKKLKKF
jgi:hypothetical protein